MHLKSHRNQINTEDFFYELLSLIIGNDCTNIHKQEIPMRIYYYYQLKIMTATGIQSYIR